MTLFTQTPGASILDNYADVIEGGNTYASGTSYSGIPGSHSVQTDIAGVTFTSDAKTTTTTVQANDLSDAESARLVRTDGPKFFLRCVTGEAENIGAARPITAYTPSTNTFTVAPAFPTAPQAGDTFISMEGFKRAPDTFDINSDEEGVAGGFDRYFDLRLVPGKRAEWEGSGNKWYDAVLELRLRLLKHKRSRQFNESLVDNLTFLRTVMSMPASRDGTYVQRFDELEIEPEIEVEDQTKAVIMVPFGITYKVVAAYV